MPLHPETCPHCGLALTLTRRAFDLARPPPEAIREALLIGIGMGEIGAGDTPSCDECRTYIEAIRVEHERILARSEEETPKPAPVAAVPQAPRAAPSAPGK